MADASPKQSRGVTVTSIAKMMGVSAATVSRALNKTGQVSPVTQRKILRVASEMGYVADPRFRAMGQTSTGGIRRTGNIGLLLPHAKQSQFVTDPYYARLFWSIESSANRHGFHLTMTCVEAEEGCDFLPRFISDMGVDGVLVSRVYRDDLLRRITSLLPVVLVNQSNNGLPIPSIMPNEEAAIRMALNYLRGLGHERITYFDIHDRISDHHILRTEAFSRFSADRASEHSLILPTRNKSLEATAVDVLRAWRDADQMPTALLCGADVYALAFLDAAECLGICVPEELSVLGVDDTIFCERSRPKLTSISQPLEEMGAAAIRLLKDMIEYPDEPRSMGLAQLFDVRLKERASCSQPRTSSH